MITRHIAMFAVVLAIAVPAFAQRGVEISRRESGARRLAVMEQALDARRAQHRVRLQDFRDSIEADKRRRR